MSVRFRPTTTFPVGAAIARANSDEEPPPPARQQPWHRKSFRSVHSERDRGLFVPERPKFSEELEKRSRDVVVVFAGLSVR